MLKGLSIGGRAVKRAALGGGELLGGDYELLEWIEDTQTKDSLSAIDTRIACNDSIVCQFKFAFIEPTGYTFIGNYVSENDSSRFFTHLGYFYLDFCNLTAEPWSRINTNANPMARGDVRTIEYGNCYIKDLETGSVLISRANGAVPAFTKPYNVLAMAGGKNRLWWLKIYDQGALARDFVAARRLADGVLGLYDRVGREFFAGGLQSYIAGPPTGRYY